MGAGWILSSRGMGGWVRGGLITSFNIYISHVKKIQNEEREILRDFVFWKFSLVNSLRSKKEKTQQQSLLGGGTSG